MWKTWPALRRFSSLSFFLLSVLFYFDYFFFCVSFEFFPLSFLLSLVFFLIPSLALSFIGSFFSFAFSFFGCFFHRIFALFQILLIDSFFSILINSSVGSLFDSFMDLLIHSRISIRGCVCPSVSHTRVDIPKNVIFRVSFDNRASKT